MFKTLISSCNANNLLQSVKSLGNNIEQVLQQSKPLSIGRWRRGTTKNSKMSRTWQRVKGAETGYLNDGNKIYTLLSYNILAQDLLIEHIHLYDKVMDSSMLLWNHRLLRLTEEIQHIKPDILCLQEMQFNHLKGLVKNISFKRQLEYVFKKKTGHRTDGCVIIYDKSKFRLIAEQPVEYYSEDSALLNRDNVALLAKFSVKNKPDHKFIIATTHLLYNPKRQDVRIAQVEKLLTAIQQFSVEHDNGKNIPLPVILTGDFNFQPQTAPYHLLSTPFKSRHPSVNRKESQSSLLFSDQRVSGGKDEGSNSLQMSPLDFGENTASTFQQGWITVDYILHSIDKNRRKLKIQSIYGLPKINECIRMGLIPNKFIGSDHYSLGIKFSLF